MVRVLHIVSSLKRGGVETFIMNVYRRLDRNKIQFDFIVPQLDTTYDYEEEIKKMGGNIYKVPPKRNSPLRNMKQVKAIVEKNKYKVVHRHSGRSAMAIDLLSARIGGATTRIAHAHNAQNKVKFQLKEEALQGFFRPILNWVATDCFACSLLAAEWVFGKCAINQGKIEIVNNAVNLDQFRYNKNLRTEVRSQLGLNGKFVVGHVGRFYNQKNHKFLIDVFFEIKKLRESSTLLLIGEGELENTIKEKVKILGLEKDVVFMGGRDDVNKIMQAMDVFVLPSFHEGLPLVGVEAQASGLPCFFSDAVTGEVAIINSSFLKLENSPIFWARLILEKYKTFERFDTSQLIRKAGYDIEAVVNDLSKYYLGQL